MAVQIIPKEPTITEMKKEAEECERTAASEPEPRASASRENAALLREWIASLKTGAWKS
jgi:hypothetical protein